MSLEPGYVIGGRYRIEAAVGGGGFGTVYRATQLNLGRAVAVKVLHATLMMTEAAQMRFRREAELAQQLRHPNTVRVFDFGQTDHGYPFIVWEYLEGLPINQLIDRQGPMPAQRVVHIASQVLKALMEAHSLGIVHRDIKPANVIVGDFAGEPDFVKVLDFGVAKALGESGMTMTDGTTPLGTPSYMAPEQVRNEQVTPVADLYALGLMIVEMLTARVVFQGRSVIDVFMAQASEAPPPIPSEVLSGPLGPVVQRATHKHAAHRYGSAAEMLRELEHAGASSIQYAPGMAPTWPGAQSGSVAPPTPISPYQPSAFVSPTVGATSGGVQVITAAPMPASERGRGMIALAIFGGLLAIGVLGSGVAGAIYWASRSEPAPLRSEPAAQTPAQTTPAGAGAPVEFGARAGKGYDGIGATVAVRKIEPTGWKKTGDTIKNIEATYTSTTVRIVKGGVQGKIELFRFDDSEECASHETTLRNKPDTAVSRDSGAIIQVSIPGNTTEAKKLLALITG